MSTKSSKVRHPMGNLPWLHNQLQYFHYLWANVEDIRFIFSISAVFGSQFLQPPNCQCRIFHSTGSWKKPYILKEISHDRILTPSNTPNPLPPRLPIPSPHTRCVKKNKAKGQDSEETKCRRPFDYRARLDLSILTSGWSPNDKLQGKAPRGHST